ncbi:TrAP [Tomato golden mosaic virus]|uniref:Transcriptional activator protein n=2 Tax=Tomato golden mosaic virus TaxID=10831 RepID=TRAP_TGMVY|nr:TrAP [Tomato golden mosaic virus]P03562.1 RecName: Full=Transcriptional activator protein; Short=TrAP; AltName: Full=Protein AC2; AltName: Full=Protein AL2 [Tomato golden mosaic virus-Yellow vein]AEI91451.1 transcriptional regulator [Tomato golden mosaic virus]
MRNSSSSTPPSIKAQHRAAKRRAIRRRRIDLNCGCSIYIHIDCRNNGFTHRGTYHCASSREWRLYLGDNKSPLFQDNQRRGSPLHQHQDIPLTNQVQPQPEESIGSPQGISQLPSMDDIDDSFWENLFK